MRRRHFLPLIATTPMIGSAHASPRALPPLRGYLRTNWSKDPFAYGSYSHIAAGSGDHDRRTVAAPIDDRVFFAGEALNANYQSSTHAAYESGVAVAKTLLERSRRRVAIVGAGMSGLAAAHWLAERGADVTVFEGRDRIGGRIWTDRSLGAAVDLGATWIHGPDGNPITALADQAGLARVATKDDAVIRGGDGRRIWSLFAPDWLAEIAIQTTTAVERDKINTKEADAYYETYGLGYAGGDVKFPNGYDEVFTSLAGDYEVLLSHVVTRIASSQSDVALSFDAGAARTFDAVIVTAPLGVLKAGAIAFDPPLPAEKSAAIARMGMGTLDKLYLLFDDVFWDQDATLIFTPENDLPRGHFNYWVNFHRYLDTPILLALHAATPALTLSEETDDALIARALQTLERAYAT